MLNILVTVKVVPKPEEVKVDQETKTLDRGNARSEINPADMAVIETALKLKDKYGANVTVLSMGPPFADKFIKVAMAMGCDNGVLLTDRVLAGADTLATSYALAKAIDAIGDQDLVICGEESSDGATGQVPQGIAEWLDFSHVTYATALDLDEENNKLEAVRSLSNVTEKVRVPLPAVAAITTGAHEPRFMDFERRQELENGNTVKMLSAADIKVDPKRIGNAGSPTIVTGLKQLKTPERKNIRIEGKTAAEKAERIWEYLEKEGILKN